MAHRYWRVIQRWNQNQGATAITELEMRQTPGGANVCIGGTAITGSGFSDPPANAFDGNLSTFWQGFNWQGIWLGYDFGPGNDKDIQEIKIWPNVGFSVQRTPFLFFVQYSDDNITWSTQWYCTYSNWVVGTPVTFTIPTVQSSNRYWAVFSRFGQSTNQFGLAELQFKEVIGGPSVIGGGTGVAVTVGFGGTIAGAFDNNINTFYCMNESTEWGGFLGYDFGAGNNKAIIEATFIAQNDGNFGRATTEGIVGYSQDGLSWLPLISYSGLGYSGAAASQTVNAAPPSAPNAQVYELVLIAISNEYDLQQFKFPFNLGGIGNAHTLFIQR